MIDPEEHREDVVRRLLDRGLSPATLRAMLPTFDEVITRVLAARAAERAPAREEAGPAGHDDGAAGPGRSDAG